MSARGRKNEALLFSNPKRQSRRRGDFYRYYAGYSEDFVRNVIAHLKLGHKAKILDPWNGSGTTTSISRDLGHDAYGYDINPAAIVIAKARNLDHGVADSLESLTAEIITKAKQSVSVTHLQNDPLENWLNVGSAKTIRAIEYAIDDLLVDDGKNEAIGCVDVNPLSDLAAFFLVALFQTTRAILRPFIASNPTWIKTPRSKSERIDCAQICVMDLFQSYLHEQKQKLTERTRFERQGACQIEVASSTKLPLSASTVDAVITSPPYCTRIDYAVAMLPELAVLRFPIKSGLKNLRRQMIGAPVIVADDVDANPVWGRACNRLLDDVEYHRTKASDTYYLKNLTQYFDGVFRSLTEIDRVLKKGGTCAVVVQDSFYKDVHIDLPKIFHEMGREIGWTTLRRVDYRKSQVLGRINPKTKPYRTSAQATEAAIFFQRA